MPVVVGVDIGGTKVLGLAVDDDRVPLGRVYEPHAASGGTAVADLIADVIRRCARGQEISAAGVAVAGWLSADRRTVRTAANLGLHDDRLADAVSARVGVPVLLENDGDAAALAEHRFGAARGSRVSITLTVGTGVGGGVVIDGRPLTGGHGLGAELGHLSLDADGTACICGGRGCLETYASGPAIAQAAGYPDTYQVIAAARTGQPAARAALTMAGMALGFAVTQLAPALDPEVVVLGGGLAVEADELLIGPMRRALRRPGSLSVVADPPALRVASCGTDAGALGAAAAVTQALTPLGGPW